jgi:hypothetical protein
MLRFEGDVFLLGTAIWHLFFLKRLRDVAKVKPWVNDPRPLASRPCHSRLKAAAYSDSGRSCKPARAGASLRIRIREKPS